MYARLFLSFFILVTCLLESSAQAKQALPGPVKAEVVRVIDGDTIDIRASIWIDQTIDIRVRMLSVDTPELRGKCADEKALALRAKEALTAWLQDGHVVLKNIRYGKFAGRVLADLETLSGDDLSQRLIHAGLARPYAGGERLSWCDW